MNSKALHKLMQIGTLFIVLLLVHTPVHTVADSEGNSEYVSTVQLEEAFSLQYENDQTFREIENSFGATEFQGDLHISYFFDGKIGIFSQNGEYIDTFSPDFLGYPAGMETNGTHLFVADRLEQKIMVFDSKYENTHNISRTETGDFWNFYANGTHVFIVDANDDEIEIFTYDGEFVSNHTLASIARPFDMVEYRNLYYVLDADADAIRVYDKQFQLLMTHSVGLDRATDLEVDDGLLFVANSTNVLVFDETLQLKNVIDNFNGNNFFWLDFVEIIGSRLFVMDEQNNAVFVYDKNVVDLSATSSTQAIRVSWRVHNSTDILQYNVYRGTDSHNLQLIATVPADQGYFEDSIVVPKIEYFYRVSIVNQVGETALSDSIVSASLAQLTTNTTTESTTSETSTATNDTEDGFFSSLPINPLFTVSGLLTVAVITRYRST